MAIILGINLSELREDGVLKKITDFLNSNDQHYLVTPNPEIILSAQSDEELFHILNRADLAIADGIGLKIAGILSGLNIPRVTGADLTVKLLKMAAQKGLRTLILNWSEGLSKKTDIELALIQKFTGLNFTVFNISRDKLLDQELIKQINKFAPVLFFNTLGFPYQEKLIYHNLKKLPSVKVALGIGGSFDFITGQAIRAPKVIRVLGLEWLWRLIKQPKRLKRIYNATWVFLKKILLAKFK